MNVKAYRLAEGTVHGVAGEKLVVVKKTISPATAGNPDTFSSTPAPSTFSSYTVAVVAPVAPLSRTTAS